MNAPRKRDGTMRPYPSRSGPPPDPVVRDLKAVRLGLLRLHKALIDSERAVFEQSRGRLTSGQFLQALLQEPFFEWLRPFSGLIVRMDEALAAEEPVTEEDARSLIDEVRALVEGERYEAVRDRDPDVLVAHVELTGRITAAVDGGGG